MSCAIVYDSPHGRRSRTARRTARPRRVPAALEDGPAVGAAHRGRGAADPRGDRARRRVAAPRRRRAGRAAAGDVAIAARPGPLHVRRRPRRRRRRRSSSPASAARRPTGRSARGGMGARRAHVGQRRRRRDGDAHRHLRARGRGQRAAAARAAGAARAARGRVGLPGDPAAGRRDRQGRAGAGGRARPAARPAADRRPARLVRAPGGAAPGWYRASGDPVVGPALRLLHHKPRTRGRSPSWRARPASRAPRWPAASTSSWASRR